MIFENKYCRLTVGENGIVESLKLLSAGEELADGAEGVSLFSVTQLRPFNNEVKLAHPNKRTTFEANHIAVDEEDGSLLHVTFQTVPVKANIRFTVKERYMAFSLESFTVLPEDYGIVAITPPPVCEFRLLQIPLKERAHFGEWLNTYWDEHGAVCVCAATPFLRVDSEKRRNGRIFYADALYDTGLQNRPAVLAAVPEAELMNAIADVEEDYDLPRGVRSREDKMINASVYWAADVNPETVDEHIRYAKAGGFRLMLLYYSSMFEEVDYYNYIGNYDYRKQYPNGRDDLVKMLEKIKAAGILPGLHVLQTHIGLKSRYVVPKVDPRIRLKRHFTLAKALPAAGGDKFDLPVFENPVGSETCDGIRILRFGTELISYEGFVTEPPFRFTGCVRGDHGTEITEHPAGEVGGILDVSEFCAGSAYVDQNTDLQDEIADIIADTYNAGFRFLYLDGSEGTNPPYEIHVPNAQYRVYKKCHPAPLFVEGAAKAHFSWHMLSGGNAFDIFEPEIFKDMIVAHPFAEAPRMYCDRTRLNFGWWAFWDKRSQPDQYEFGTSRAAAWDCPATLQTHVEAFKTHKRSGDILAVLKRWEDARAEGWLTEEHKTMLKNGKQEHHLFYNEKGEFELLPYDEMKEAAGGNAAVRVYTMNRAGTPVAVFWHATDEGILRLPLSEKDVEWKRDLMSDSVKLEHDGNGVLVPIGDVHYLISHVDEATFKKALAHAVLTSK